MEKDCYFYTNCNDYYSPANILNFPLRIPIAAKYLYALMLQRMNSGLSDQEGKRYVICEKQELSYELKEPISRVEEYLIVLEAAKLVETRYNGSFYMKKAIFA